MKRKITMALVLVMLLGLLVPQAALATTRYYLELSITETNAPNRTVTGTSGYLSIDSDSLTGAVVQVINSKYAGGKGELKVFGSQAMKAILKKGLDAYGSSQWESFVTAYHANPTIINANDAAVTVNLKDKLVDLNTTPNALTVGTLYQLSYAPANVSAGDPARGNTYVVSFTLKEYTTGEAEQPGETKPVEYPLASPENTGVAKLLNTDDHMAFMVGDDKGNFRPNDSITRAEVAQMFYRLLRDQNVEITKTFADVKENAWYATAVGVLASSGIINGTSETTFEPERAITRAEFTAICTRFAAAASGSVSFTDVPVNHWAYGAISTAVSYGWIRGDGTGKFNPDAKITRAEAVAIANRVLGRLGDSAAIKAGEGKRFPDVSESFWGFESIVEATSEHGHSFDAKRQNETWTK